MCIEPILNPLNYIFYINIKKLIKLIKMNPVLESLFKHKSIRKYKEQPLEDEKLQLIIKAAQAAPTWCNGQQVYLL